MNALSRTVGPWMQATADVGLAVFALVIGLLPALTAGNALAGEPLSSSSVGLVVGVLALGGAYPFVAGDWSAGALGEFVFVFVLAVFGWGIAAMVTILASGVELSGADPRPGAALLALAYSTAFVVVLVGGPIFD